MNEYQEPYEKEISLMELLFFCLKKWRWIVAAMLVVAVLAGVYKFQSTVSDNQGKQEAQLLEDGEEEKGTEVISNPNVEYYEMAIENWQQELDDLRTYIDSSVIMQLEPYHLDTGNLSFYVNAGDVREEVWDTLLSAYEEFATDGRLAAALVEANDSISESEMQYLVSFEGVKLPVSGENYEIEDGSDPSTIRVTNLGADKPNVFRIQITADNEENCAEYMEAAKEALTAYSAELNNQLGVSHELLILSESQTERIDQDIQTYQNGILNAYSSAFTQVKNLQTELDTVLEEEGATIEVGTTVTYENPVSEAVKFAIIGLVLGAFLAAFVLVVVYLMSGKLQSTDSFREEFGMPLLGQITKHPHKKRLFGFIDNWFQRIEEGAYADITYEEQLKIAAANLKTAASKEQGLKKVMLAGTMSKDEAEAFRSMLAAELEGIELSSYERIVFQASALEELDSYDGVVFLEKKGASYAKLIKKERDLVADRDVRILGVVVL